MVPSTPDPTRYRSVQELLRTHAERTPEKVFLHSIDQDSQITWGEAHRLCNRVARFLADKGIGANDRIVVLTENSLENLILYFAILRHGATFCTVNVEINAAHLRDMLERLRPKLVLWHDALDADELGVGAPGEWIPFGRLGRDGGLFELIEGYPEMPELPTVGGPDDAAVIGFTSGTSAAPKGVIHNFDNYFWIADQTIAMWRLTQADRMLEYRSFSWASSHMLSLMPCIVTGATLVFARRFSQSRFFGWIRDFEPTVAIGIPTVINMLLNRSGDADPGDFASLRFMSCSTAPLMTEQHVRFEEAYGIPLVQLYGMSESGVVAANHHDARRIGSVGPPGLYQNLEIVDDTGGGLATGEIGEIEIGGAQSAHGYLLEDGSIEKIRGRRLRTGDLGFLDEDGYLYITGRAKDVIIRGGVNISPLEIDNVLVAHPDIVEAATIGVPDEMYGEEVVSYVAGAPSSGLAEQVVLAHCARTLPDFKRPKRVVVTDAIAKNDRGKVDRGALSRRWKDTDSTAYPIE